MWDGLSTGVGARRPGSGLSGSIFSGPHDCADRVNSLQVTEKKPFQEVLLEHFDGSGVRADGLKTGRSIISPQPMVHLRQRSTTLAKSADWHALQGSVPPQGATGRARSHGRLTKSSAWMVATGRIWSRCKAPAVSWRHGRRDGLSRRYQCHGRKPALHL